MRLARKNICFVGFEIYKGVIMKEKKTKNSEGTESKAARRGIFGLFRKKKEEDGKKKLKSSVVIKDTLFSFKTVSKVSPGILWFEIPQAVVLGIVEFMYGSFLLRLVVNSFEAGEPIWKISTYIIAVYVFAYVCWTVSAFYNQFLWPKYKLRIEKHVEAEAFMKARRVELSCYENPESYDRLEKALNGIADKIYENVWVIWSQVNRIVTLSANAFLVFFIDPGLIVFALLPLFLGFLRTKRNKLNHDRSAQDKILGRKRQYVKRAFYLAENAKEMRLTSFPEFMFAKHKEVFEETKILYKNFGKKLVPITFLLDWSIDGGVVVLAMLYAAYKTLVAGSMTAGDCIVVFSSITSISYAINQFVADMSKFHENALYVEDYKEFTEYDPKIKGGEASVRAEPSSIIFENVSFGYDGSEKDVLRNISFEIHPGEKIALIGENGAGKSTLVKLLLRLYDTTSGRITIGGKDIKDYTLSSVSDSFGVVFQDCHPFSVTVAENVLLRPFEEGDEDRVIDALKQSGAYEKIESLPNGIHTVLTREFDDEGTNLSGGELQKVELARIFATPTPFVILDEPSSALDPVAEHKMFENMMRACEGRSTVFISHRLSSATLADRVILLENGEIAEIGSHRELMEKGGKYAELFSMQAAAYNIRKGESDNA